jgi:heptosyltransferase-2
MGCGETSPPAFSLLSRSFPDHSSFLLRAHISVTFQKAKRLPSVYAKMNKVRGALPIDKSTIHRILIRATNWVGDAVMSMPAFEAVRENFPEAHITVLARPWVTPLYESHPAVNEVIPYKRGHGVLKDSSEFLRVIRLIRALRFDMAVLFQNAFEAALIARLGGINIRVGYNTDGRGFLLSHPVVKGTEVLKLHQVEYYLTLLRAVGWDAPTRDPVLAAGRFRRPRQSAPLLKGIKIRIAGRISPAQPMALQSDGLLNACRHW